MKEVWRPSARASLFGLTRLAFAGTPVSSGYPRICAVDRWDVEFETVAAEGSQDTSSFGDAPARATSLHVTRVYKFVGAVGDGQATSTPQASIRASCTTSGSAKSLFLGQGEQDCSWTVLLR